MNKLFIITGQTATGKTSLALELARKYDGELVNADSRQIYKHLDIITGKDIPENSEFKIRYSKDGFDIGYYEFAIANHGSKTRIWLYDIVDPKIYFSSFDFVQCAIPVIKDILKRGKTPIIVGGTYFYMYHLLYDVPTQSIPGDWKLRNILNEKSVRELQSMLKKIAPQFFKQLSQSEVNNPQRLIRKIEILRYKKKHKQEIGISSFKPYSAVTLDHKIGKVIDIKCNVFFFKDNTLLRKTITNRVENRITQGAFEEVKKLLDYGYTIDNPGMKTIGYHQIIRYFKKEFSKSQAIEEWVSKEIQFAKRQKTFMKRDQNMQQIII